MFWEIWETGVVLDSFVRKVATFYVKEFALGFCEYYATLGKDFVLLEVEEDEKKRRRYLIID